ncbi:MAG: hypothetical protein JO121_19430 [Deltaproteobacteria bacterium]|nr:hypothetical protein [Deltaproteobacteria bacterium]
MKNLLLGIVAVVAAGCASVAPPGVQERAEAVHERTAEMDAAVKRITEVSGSTIPDHPNYTVLGPVSGDCEGSPQGNQEIIAGDSVKEAAVRKYGARVDAIINSDAVYVATGGGTGYRECTGTAVSYASAAAAAAPQ